ncbi:MAG: hypothetical protein RLY21_214 [Planctomycetota bacterium]|jgi:hypothetical protein
MTTTLEPPRRIAAVSVIAMTIAGGVARSSTLLSQILVGLFVTEREVGTYAVAVGITGLTCVFRGGGASLYLPSIRRDEFDSSAGRIFWWGLAFRILCSILTFGAALALPHLDLADPPPRLAETLQIFAVSQLVLAFSIVGRIRMSVQQRFTELARLDIVTSLCRVAATAILAWGGAGPLALVIPIALAPLVELGYYILNGTLGSISYRWVGGTLRQTAVLMAMPAVASILIALNSQLNFLIVKPMLVLASMGVYYFAYQLASQPSLLIATPLTNVLATHFAAERGDPERESRAIVSIGGGAVLFSSLLSCGMIAVFPAADRLLWAGKWSEAVIPIVALGGSACWSTAVGIISPALAGLRRFRAMALFEALKGIGIFSGAALGALVVGLSHEGRIELPESLALDSTLVSISTGAMVSVMSIAQLMWLMRTHGAGATAVAKVLVQGPVLSAVAAVVAYTVATQSVQYLPAAISGGSVRTLAFAECVIGGTVYAVSALFILRFAAAGSLRDAVAVLPGRPRSLAERFLRL